MVTTTVHKLLIHNQLNLKQQNQKTCNPNHLNLHLQQQYNLNHNKSNKSLNQLLIYPIQQIQMQLH